MRRSHFLFGLPDFTWVTIYNVNEKILIKFNKIWERGNEILMPGIDNGENALCCKTLSK